MILEYTYGKGTRLGKCKFCGDKDTPLGELVKHVVERPSGNSNLYFHEECYSDYLEELEFKANEVKERDELNETLKDVLMRPQFGTYIWTLIQAVRNGEEIGLVSSRKKSQRYKEGVTYSKLNEAFKYSKDDIQYILRTKNFDNNIAEFKYALQLAISNLVKVEGREERLERTKKQKEALARAYEPYEPEEEYKSSYIPPKDRPKPKKTLLDYLDD